MANINAPFGFQPARPAEGELRLNKYYINSGLSSDIFEGDLLEMSGGYVQAATDTTDVFLGVFMGCVYTDPNSKQPRFSNRWVASTTDTLTDAGNGVFTPYALVLDDPDAELKVQCVGSAVVANVGKNASLDVSVTGNTTTNLSGMMLGSSFGTSSAQFRVTGIYPADNNTFATNVILRVRINVGFHYYRQNVAT